MSLPNVNAIRQRLQKATKPEAKFSLMSAYLFCARVSEIVAVTSPSEIGHTLARGPTPNDLEYKDFTLGDLKEEVAVFTVRTAKRDGKPRKVGLPLNPKYEPFTKPLCNYFESFNPGDPVFGFTRQKAHSFAKVLFEGYEYSIDSYNIKKDGKIEKVPFHMRNFRNHALRHLRATELLEDFDFKGYELAVYGGWTLKSMIGGSSAMSRYAHTNWKSYFPKLLRTRR